MNCVKCGGSDISTSYHKQGCSNESCSCATCAYGAHARQHAEHLHYNCRTCQFDWVGELADPAAVAASLEMWIDGSRYAHDGVTRYMTGSEIRALPTPAIRDSEDLFVEVPDGQDLIVGYDEAVEAAGRRFVSIPRFINAG